MQEDTEPVEELGKRVGTIEAQLRQLSADFKASSGTGQTTNDARDSDLEKVKGLAQTTFAGVLDADKTHDDKAQRILSTMAFLTAAAAAIFTRSNPPNLALDVYVLDTYVATLPANVSAFAGYMLLIGMGAILYLASLGGGALNLPSRFRDEDKSSNSLLFFMRIGRLNPEEWRAQWKKGYRQLAEEMKDNYIYESYLIAQTARAKVKWLAFGSSLFKLAILALLFLTSSVLAPDLWQFWAYGLLGSSLFFLSTLIEAYLRPNQHWDAVTVGLALFFVVSMAALLKVLFVPTLNMSHMVMLSAECVIVVTLALGAGIICLKGEGWAKKIAAGVVLVLSVAAAVYLIPRTLPLFF